MATEQNAQPTASEQQIADLRQKMGTVTEKVKNDSSFASKLKSEPAATLKAEGFDDDAIGETLKHWKAEAEVEGHGYWSGCTYFTDYEVWSCTYTN